MSYSLNSRLKWQPSARKANLATLKSIVGNTDHYVSVPASEVNPSFVKEVNTKVTSLQSIVDSMTRKMNPNFVGAALSYYSEALILACGIACIQRTLDEPEKCTADAEYIKNVISSALIVKNEEPETSNRL
tara:strand:+ start:260 stop:652 length:393 start_codon:yes stop_codon:yes gene_type:complete